MENEITEVEIMFRVAKYPGCTPVVEAIFPHNVETHTGLVKIFDGCHNSGDYDYCIRKSRPATPEEYADLKSQMEAIGYKFKIVRRQNRQKYLKSLKDLKN